MAERHADDETTMIRTKHESSLLGVFSDVGSTPRDVAIYTRFSSLTALQNATLEAAPPCGGVMVSTGLLVAERHAGVWTPVIAHKTISAEPQFALAA